MINFIKNLFWIGVMLVLILIGVSALAEDGENFIITIIFFGLAFVVYSIFLRNKKFDIKINNGSPFNAKGLVVLDSKNNVVGTVKTILPNNYIILTLSKGTKIKIFDNRNETIYVIKGTKHEKNIGITF